MHEAGIQRGQSGLTAEEAAARRWRAEAESNYKWTVHVAEQLGERRPQKTGWAGAHYGTRTWRDLSWGEQWWMQQLRSGALMRELHAAQEAHGGRVEAPPFAIVGAPIASSTWRLRSRSPRRSRCPAPATAAAPAASTTTGRTDYYRRRMQAKLGEFKVHLARWKKGVRGDPDQGLPVKA